MKGRCGNKGDEDLPLVQVEVRATKEVLAIDIPIMENEGSLHFAIKCTDGGNQIFDYV